MNDVVFAGDCREFAKYADKYNRCLKVLTDGKSVKLFVAGATPLGEGTLACIEQPLMPLSRTPEFTGDAEGLAHAVLKAAEYIKSSPDGAILKALGELIVSYVTENVQSGGQPVVETLKEQLDSSFADPTFSVEAAIRKLPLNYDYVRKLFKKETGLTPHEYLTELRMKRAKNLILSGVTNRYSPYSVSQIAEACGFLEPLYFSRVFKKYYGVSPAKYGR